MKMSKLNTVDRLLGYFSPKSESERLKARILNDRLRRIYLKHNLAYEGASKTRRTEGWNAMSTSVNDEISGALATLRDRSRDLVRNNPYAKRALRSLANNVVGAGIIPQATHPSASEKVIKRFDDLWIEWGDSTLCDADGRMDFYGIQQLAVKTIFQSGEVLIRRRRRLSSDNLPVPMQLQVMEPDFLDTTKDFQTGNDGNVIIQGIEFNKAGQRVAYWLFDEHPGGRFSATMKRFTSHRVPAEDILHLYFVERPGQVRGIPEPAPVIIRIKDYDDYEDASLLRQKIAACFTAFITENDISDTPLSGEDDDGDDDYGKVEPGLIERLPPGRDVKFGQPPTADGGPDFARGKLRGIAAGLDMTYEMMTGDLSNVNFSSGRMGWLEFQRSVQTWHWQLLIPGLCKPVWRWFVESAEIAGAAHGPMSASWTPPRREMIDPVKETTAIEKQIRTGLLTLSEAIRQYGYDPQTVLLERKRDNDKLDELGIIVDSDPRAVQGKVQDSSEDETED
jgi:lambda family phage portal protein